MAAALGAATAEEAGHAEHTCVPAPSAAPQSVRATLGVIRPVLDRVVPQISCKNSSGVGGVVIDSCARMLAFRFASAMVVV
jgi:hypothetical protein